MQDAGRAGEGTEEESEVESAEKLREEEENTVIRTPSTPALDIGSLATARLSRDRLCDHDRGIFSALPLVFSLSLLTFLKPIHHEHP
jgi:hypothetical protein